MSVFDIGPYNDNSVDYPDYAKKLGNRIKLKKSDVGILVCGSGTGMAISANKIKSIRAAVCYNMKSTRLSRQHNNANIIALGSRLTKKNLSLNAIHVEQKMLKENCGSQDQIWAAYGGFNIIKFNIANEYAVDLFKKNKIKYTR